RSACRNFARGAISVHLDSSTHRHESAATAASLPTRRVGRSVSNGMASAIWLHPPCGASTMKQPVDTDYPLSEVPAGARKGLWSTSILLFGFTFFTATMFAGGKIGLAFDFKTMLWAAVIGNLLLGLYAAALGLIACRSGLNSVLMGRFCFGEVGSKLSDMLLGFTQIGWYAWGTATIAIILVKILGLPEGLTIPLMVLFGFGFCLTAFVGYKGLDLLSRIAVPAMLVLLVASLWIATR